ncbi:hypothetical protein F4815DRAFT_499938 [Daldinia loculata]|nr:hypothetical protein F4815DRAFT_499938 [Daldinia loculata]
MLKLAVLGIRGFLLLFGAVVLGLSVTLAKQQVEGAPPAETSFGSFCGAFGILVSLIGIAALFVDKIPSIVPIGADGLATALYLAGAIALTVALKSVPSCTSDDSESNYQRAINKLLTGGCGTLADKTYCPGLPDDLMKKWSHEHTNHVPILFMLEFKTPETGTGGGAPPIPWNDSELLDDLDAEIRSVFSPSQLITADDVRRDNYILDQSTSKYEWPDLDLAHGRVLFLIDNEPGPIRDVYTAGRPNLEGRVIFTNSKPGYDDCAFQKLNDPRNGTDLENIWRQVRAGYWVRTRADKLLTTILRNDTTSMRDSVFASGAQIVSTEFPTYRLTSRWHVDYAARFDVGIAVRCNPIIGKDDCVNTLLEPEDCLRN